ncbi:MAG TPA: MOSC N-terminal beta barrel domain-containing protein [Solirubrobacteraceae bacterium]
MSDTAIITELWRYPVKSMGGERVEAVAVGERGPHADRMWAVRDPAVDAISTARKFPALLQCSARYPSDPTGHPAEPGNAPEVVIVLPGGDEVSSADPAVHARLSEVVGSDVRLEPLPPLSEKDRYRAPRQTKAGVRAALGVKDDEPIPDLSMFPLKMLAELGRYVTPLGSFVDAYPVHVLTHASLAAMAAQAPGSDFDVRRFRPNVVVDTGDEPGLPETQWCGADLIGPGAALRGEIPTIRCVMPTRAQGELGADPDVLRTVAAHAERCLGLYATVARPGRLAVGDELRVQRPAPPSRTTALARAGTATVKRGVLRAASAMLPRG